MHNELKFKRAREAATPGHVARFGLRPHARERVDGPRRDGLPSSARAFLIAVVAAAVAGGLATLPASMPSHDGWLRFAALAAAAAVAQYLAFEAVDFGQPIFLSKVYDIIQNLPQVTSLTVFKFSQTPDLPANIMQLPDVDPAAWNRSRRLRRRTQPERAWSVSRTVALSADRGRLRYRHIGRQ